MESIEVSRKEWESNFGKDNLLFTIGSVGVTKWKGKQYSYLAFKDKIILHEVQHSNPDELRNVLKSDPLIKLAETIFYHKYP